MWNRSLAESKDRHAYIDGLRGLAILAVLAQHTMDHSIRVPETRPLPWLIRALVCGQYGVQLFFVLSAFTLYATSRRRVREEAAFGRNFFLRRAFRILPLWWIATCLYASITHPPSENIFATATFFFGPLQPWVPLGVFDAQWSVFVEETFYWALPWLFLRVQGPKRAFGFLLATLGACALWNCLAPALRHPQAFLIYQYPPTHWYCFASGILLFQLSGEPRFRNAIDRAEVRYVIGVALALLLITLPSLESAMAKQSFATLASSLLFALALAPHSTVRRVLEWRWLGQFGICCYSIYLFHLLIPFFSPPLQATFFHALGDPADPQVRFLLWFPLMAALNLAIGSLTFRFLERPSVAAGRWLIAWLSREKCPALA
jgi:peptidoglycan/LPS O-acetylase OafA/YrhL